jgi:signal peptidase I
MIYIFLVIAILAWHIGMYGMFKKAGVVPWLALIPFYNTWIIINKCKIRRYWFWLQLVPIAGQFVTIWITIIFVMHFNKVSVLDHIFVVLFPFIYFPYLGYSDNDKWVGEDVIKNYKKPASREWIDAGVFAIVAATLIRSFVFEAYVIPTGSMEKTLLVNDFLFVNKMSYGARIPETPLSFPFVHNIMPFSKTIPSYIKSVRLPYKRLPAFTEIKRNDVVVFNFPAGDTIINLPEYGSAITYYDVLRSQFKGDREALKASFPILVHPRDKTDNYIKRCVAVSGDSLLIRSGQLFINGKLADMPDESLSEYIVTTSGKGLSQEFLEDDLGIDTNNDDGQVKYTNTPGIIVLNLTNSQIKKLKSNKAVTKIEFYSENQIGATFPNDEVNYPWTIDNFGPIRIPKKDDVVEINKATIALYRRIISTYEENILEEKNGQYIINGIATNKYKIKYNYFWMMGDNRHNSQDSRYWGFVPETNIVGKASLIWFSWRNGPRWKRLFNAIK